MTNFGFGATLIHSENYAIHDVVSKPEYALLYSHLHNSGPAVLLVFFHAEVYTYLYSESVEATC